MTAPQQHAGLDRGRPSSEPLSTPAVELSNVTEVFSSKGRRFTAISEVNLTVRTGEFLSVVGPSGCGKSTLLSLIAGMRRPTSGSVKVAGKEVRGISEDVGFAFQRDALLPWRSAIDNVALPLRFRGVGRKDAREQAAAWLDRVGLAKFADNYPAQLSGGMRKRVAIATSLVYSPSVLLMDEPFSALDVQTRTLMEDELLQLWASTSASVVFVTHDLEEAISLADKVCVLTAGPATVKGIYTIDLPRPRNVAEIRFEPRFVELYQTIWDDLKSEVMISYERAKHGSGA
jgi:NitT/TauT family transport system ATP-binding protein